LQLHEDVALKIDIMVGFHAMYHFRLKDYIEVKKRKKKLKYPSRVFQFLEQKHIGEKLSIDESLFAESGKKIKKSFEKKKIWIYNSFCLG